MESNSPSRTPENSSGGLFRSLLLPLLALVLVVGALGTFWAGWVQVTEERIRLRETLEGNSRLLERMNLPMSGRMAENLSTAMGHPVAIVFPDNEVEGGDGWDTADMQLASQAANSDNAYAKEGGKEAIAVELTNKRGHLVVLREKRQLLDFREARLWALLMIILTLGAVAAYLLARRLVRPLEELAEKAPDFGEAALPEHLTRRSDELGQLARALDSARERILTEQSMRKQSERLAMLGQIATGLAHEIKNPAAAILMQADAMDNKTVAKMVREEAEDIITLVNQWLFIAKPSPPRKVAHDLAASVRKFIERRSEVYAYHGIEVVLEAPEALVAECDEKRVLQAIRNLVDNGVAAMPEGGKLLVSMKQEGEQASFAVHDRGKGFSARALENFAEPFFSEKEGGMGLGLALVKGVAEAHGGGAEVFNQKDGGAVVRFWISRKESGEETP
ncbi:adaptive-response sensory-kinase SasA [Rubritalea halochordaticola]|uniref:Signal transduction histidine-protein kinase/phosphatase MprB n=1 Tax=Rubritalea halochordaticola TaxID=714537 RepID=A0ABP9V3L8_9BACT